MTTTNANIQPLASSDTVITANPTAKVGQIVMVIILPVKKAWQLFKKVSRNQRNRRHLAQLSDYLLADIGLTEAQRQAEISKPFWK